MSITEKEHAYLAVFFPPKQMKVYNMNIALTNMNVKCVVKCLLCVSLGVFVVS